MKITIQRIFTPVAISAVLSTGCATSYSPREPGRISFVMEAGHEVLEKDGKKYSLGGFSKDLIQAVSGNPAAEEHARTFVRRQRTATGLAIAAGVAFAVGDILVAFAMAEPVGGQEGANRGVDSDVRLTLGYTGLSLLVGSLVSLTVAAILGSPQGHLYDAVNIYNDGVAQRHVKPSESR